MLVYAIKDCFSYGSGTYARKHKIITAEKYYNSYNEDSLGFFVTMDNKVDGWISKEYFEDVNLTRDRKLSSII